MAVEYNPGETFYGPNMDRVDRPSFGRVKSVDVATKRVSGDIINQYRTFSNAYCISGGARWGISSCPRVGDVVGLSWDNQGNAYAFPYTVNYGSLLKDGDRSMANSGFFDIEPGELHSHSFGNSETYNGNMGDWYAHSGMGDFIHLSPVDGLYHMRANERKFEEIGYDADGNPAISLVAGLIGDRFEEVDGEYVPRKSQWVLRVNNEFVVDVTPDVDGNGSITLSGPNNTSVVLNNGGVTIQAFSSSTVTITEEGVAVNADSIDIQAEQSVTIAKGTNTIEIGENAINLDVPIGKFITLGGAFQVLYSKIPGSTAVNSLNEIGVSTKVTTI